MSDQNSEPKVRPGNSIEPELRQQMQVLANSEEMHGDLSAFAAKLVEAQLAERERLDRISVKRSINDIVMSS
jgi:hypothetical protein